MVFNHTLNDILKSREIYATYLRKLESDLNNLPEGRLNCKRVRGKTYCYHYLPKSNRKNSSVENMPVQKYIPKGNEELITALLRREFVERSLKVLRSNIKILDIFLKKFQPYDPDEIEALMAKKYEGLTYKPKAEAKYEGLAYKPKAEGTEGATSTKGSSWAQEPYQRNESHAEGLKHSTLNGLKVRSKSEAIIAGLLEANEIPFRYEAKLELGGQIFYPDFTILRPEDGQILYWEHFGMADDRQYSIAMHQKIEAYIRHGIIPGIHLIMSFETKENAIDPRAIAAMIKAYITE